MGRKQLGKTRKPRDGRLEFLKIDSIAKSGIVKIMMPMQNMPTHACSNLNADPQCHFPMVQFPFFWRQSKHAALLLLQLLCVRVTLCPQPPEALLHFRLRLWLWQAIAEETAVTRSRAMSTGLQVRRLQKWPLSLGWDSRWLRRNRCRSGHLLRRRSLRLPWALHKCNRVSLWLELGGRA